MEQEVQEVQEVCLMLLAGPFYTSEPPVHLLAHFSVQRVRIEFGLEKVSENVSATPAQPSQLLYHRMTRLTSDDPDTRYDAPRNIIGWLREAVL